MGAGVAAREALEWLGAAADRDRLRDMRDEFELEVLRLIPEAVIHGKSAARLWNTTNIGVPRLEAEALLILLSERGVCASAGAACSSGSLEPSPVLLAMGIDPVIAHGSIRFSMSRHTTARELAQAAEIFAECVRIARRSI
jgi:cysteine desulfurase